MLLEVNPELYHAALCCMECRMAVLGLAALLLRCMLLWCSRCACGDQTLGLMLLLLAWCCRRLRLG